MQAAPSRLPVEQGLALPGQYLTGPRAHPKPQAQAG